MPTVTSGWGRLTWGQADWNEATLYVQGWGAKSWVKMNGALSLMQQFL